MKLARFFTISMTTREHMAIHGLTFGYSAVGDLRGDPRG